MRRAIDLGCGPGNSTELLRAQFPSALVIGLDNSADMLAAARLRLPKAVFEQDDIAAWAHARGEPVDLLFSNAALQWVPDHASLLPALLRRLAPGGTLAVQVPDNLHEPAHVLMRAVAGDPRWADRLADARAGRDQHPPDWYEALLRAHGAMPEVWRTTYHHRLTDGPAGIVRWFESTGLRPFLQPLDPDQRVAFLADYQAALTHAYPAAADGSVLLPFPRLFLVATRATGSDAGS